MIKKFNFVMKIDKNFLKNHIIEITDLQIYECCRISHFLTFSLSKLLTFCFLCNKDNNSLVIH